MRVLNWQRRISESQKPRQRRNNLPTDVPALESRCLLSGITAQVNSISPELHGMSSVNIGGGLSGFSYVSSISITENGNSSSGGSASGSSWSGSTYLAPGNHTLTVTATGMGTNYSQTTATTSLSVNVTADDPSTSITAQNNGVTVQTYTLAWDPTATGTNGLDELEGNASFFTNGEILGQLHATATVGMASVNLSGTVTGMDSGANVSIQENGSSIGGGTLSGGTWSGSGMLSGAGSHTLTIIATGIDTVTGIHTTASTTITVTVTGTPPAITYSSTAPSSLVSVAANGMITVTNADGLEAAGGITLGVQANDGAGNIQSQFAMFLGVFGNVQSSIYMKDNQGNVFQPTTAAGLIADMHQIQSAGHLINSLIIKGHGGPDGINTGTGGGDFLVCTNNIISLADTDITTLLKNITDGHSEIRLRGCFSHTLAKRMENTLDDGTKVYGAVRFTIGIPGTCWAAGVYQ